MSEPLSKVKKSNPEVKQKPVAQHNGLVSLNIDRSRRATALLEARLRAPSALTASCFVRPVVGWDLSDAAQALPE
jgi:hypothetical protein